MRGGADSQPELQQERAGHGQDQHRGGGHGGQQGGPGAHSDLELEPSSGLEYTAMRWSLLFAYPKFHNL